MGLFISISHGERTLSKLDKVEPFSFQESFPQGVSTDIPRLLSRNTRRPIPKEGRGYGTKSRLSFLSFGVQVPLYAPLSQKGNPFHSYSW